MLSSPEWSDDDSCELQSCDEEETTVHSFNEQGYLSRKLSEAELSDGSGFSQDDWEDTAITANTISKCISSILHSDIIQGEIMISNGHINASQYDIFSSQNWKYSLPRSDLNLATLHGNGDMLQADQTPPIRTINRFVGKLCNVIQMEYECIVIMLIYVRRLLSRSRGSVVLSRDNWRAILLSSALLSNKLWADFHMRNCDYRVAFKSISLQRINSLETRLLELFDYRCNVSSSVYVATHCEIQEMISSGSYLQNYTPQHMQYENGNSGENSMIEKRMRMDISHSDDIDATLTTGNVGQVRDSPIDRTDSEKSFDSSSTRLSTKDFHHYFTTSSAEEIQLMSNKIPALIPEGDEFLNISKGRKKLSVGDAETFRRRNLRRVYDYYNPDEPRTEIDCISEKSNEGSILSRQTQTEGGVTVVEENPDEVSRCPRISVLIGKVLSGLLSLFNSCKRNNRDIRTHVIEET